MDTPQQPPRLLVDVRVNGRRYHLGKCDGTIEALRLRLPERTITDEGTDSMNVTAVLIT